MSFRKVIYLVCYSRILYPFLFLLPSCFALFLCALPSHSAVVRSFLLSISSLPLPFVPLLPFLLAFASFFSFCSFSVLFVFVKPSHPTLLHALRQSRHQPPLNQRLSPTKRQLPHIQHLTTKQVSL